MKARKGIGGGNPQPKTNKFLPNDRLDLCKNCEVAQSDRKFSPKSEPVILTGSLFVMEGGL
jgi:hypothetical protein